MSTITGARNILVGITMLVVSVGCSMPQSQTESASADPRTTAVSREVTNAVAVTEQPVESLKVVRSLRNDVLTNLSLRLEDQFSQDG
jgi:hypothetical protein